MWLNFYSKFFCINMYHEVITLSVVIPLAVVEFCEVKQSKFYVSVIIRLFWKSVQF